MKKIGFILFCLGLLYFCNTLKTSALTFSLDNSDYDTDLKVSAESLKKGIDWYDELATLDDIPNPQFNVEESDYIIWGNNIEQTKSIIYLYQDGERISLDGPLNIQNISYHDQILYLLYQGDKGEAIYIMSLEDTVIYEGESEDGLLKEGYYYSTTQSDTGTVVMRFNGVTSQSYTLKGSMIEDIIAINSEQNIIYIAFYGLVNGVKGTYVETFDVNFKGLDCVYIQEKPVSSMVLGEEIVYALEDCIAIRLANGKDRYLPIRGITAMIKVQGNIIAYDETNHKTYIINRVKDDYLVLDNVEVLDYQKGHYTLFKDHHLIDYVHVSVAYHEEKNNNIIYGFNQMYVGINELTTVMLPSTANIYGTYEKSERLKYEDITYYGQNEVVIPLKTNLQEGVSYDCFQKLTFNAYGYLNGEAIDSGMIFDTPGSYTVILKGYDDEMTTLTVTIVKPRYTLNELKNEVLTPMKQVKSEDTTDSDTQKMNYVEVNIGSLYTSDDTVLLILIGIICLGLGILGEYIGSSFILKKGQQAYVKHI